MSSVDDDQEMQGGNAWDDNLGGGGDDDEQLPSDNGRGSRGSPSDDGRGSRGSPSDDGRGSRGSHGGGGGSRPSSRTSQANDGIPPQNRLRGPEPIIKTPFSKYLRMNSRQERRTNPWRPWAELDHNHVRRYINLVLCARAPDAVCDVTFPKHEQHDAV
ncbi:hypothetical protein CYLTODRAFT_416056, partial [Cylindrobasidium torrendii FP15055 ss-10]